MPGARSGAAFCELTTEMSAPLAAHGGPAPLLTLDLAPRSPHVSGRCGLSRPGLGAAAGSAGLRSFAVLRLARLFRTALSGLRIPRHASIAGEEKPGKAGAGWPAAAVGGGGRRPGAGRRRCPPWYRPQEAPGPEQEQGTERRRRIRSAPGPAVPGRPRGRPSRCRGQGPVPFRSRLWPAPRRVAARTRA
jgi:hypothetical protein